MADNHKNHDLPQINIGDPLYRFLTMRLRLKLGHLIALWTLFNLIQVVIIPFFHHRSLGHFLFADPGSRDLQIWLVSFVSQPMVLYVYWRSVDVIPNVFISMHDNRVIRPRTGKTVAQFMYALERSMTSMPINVLALALVIFAVVVFQIFFWSTHRFQGLYGSFPFNDFQQYGPLLIHGLLRFTFAFWAIARGLLFIDALSDFWRHCLDLTECNHHNSLHLHHNDTEL